MSYHVMFVYVSFIALVCFFLMYSLMDRLLIMHSQAVTTDLHFNSRTLFSNNRVLLLIFYLFIFVLLRNSTLQNKIITFL